MARPPRKQRIYANKKNLSGCIQTFLEGLDALELNTVMNEEMTKAQIKKWGEKEVQKMAVELDKLTNPNGAYKMAEGEATQFLLKRFEDNHAEWFKGEKEKLIVHYTRMNDLFALLERQDYNISDFASAIFGSFRHHTGRINKGSIAEHQKRQFEMLKKPYDEDIQDIALAYKMPSEDVADYLMNPDKIKLVRDAYEAETPRADKNATKEAQIAVDVALAYRKLNDNILKTFRKYGVIIPDLKNYYFTSQVHDAGKMKTVEPTLMQEKMGISLNDFEKLTGIEKSNMSKMLWKKTINDLIDWQKSFMDAKTSTQDERDKVLDEMYASIMGETATGARPSEFVSKGYYNWVVGKKRQIFWKDSDSYVKYQAHYGTPNLIKHTARVINNASKNLAVFSVLGPRPEEVFKKLVTKLGERNPEILEKDYPKGTPARIKKILDATFPKYKSAALDDLSNWFKYFTTHVSSESQATAARVSAGFKLASSAKVIANLGLNSLPDMMLLRGVMKNLKTGEASSRTLRALSRYFLKSKRAESEKVLSMLGSLNRNLNHEVLYHSLRADVAAGETGAKTQKLSHYLNHRGGIETLDGVLKGTVHMAYSESLANNMDKEFKNLDPELYYKMHSHQILPEEWDGLRKHQSLVMEEKGVKYFLPFEINKLSDKDIGDIYGIKPTSKKTIELRRHDLTVKMHSFLQYQSEYVVPELNAVSDRFLEGVINSWGVSNSVGPQFAMRIVWQFKNWMMNFSSNVLKRIFQQEHKTIQSQAWDMAQLLVPLGATYTAMNYFTAYIHNQKRPGKKGESEIATVSKELLENTVDQLGILSLIANQFSARPRSLAPAASFYGHLGSNVLGILSPGETYTRWDYLSRLLGEFADISPATSYFYNHFMSQVLESDNFKNRHRPESW